jgi:squalene-hopene/tetraprenyl-beta-curcumene cyclase
MSIQFDAERLFAAGQTVRTQLLHERCPAGHWVGELSSSPLATATAISALVLAEQHGGCGLLPAYPPEGNAPFTDAVYQGDLSELIVESVHWLARQQNEDGGWGDTDHQDASHKDFRDAIPHISNIATTMLVQAAFHLTGVPAKYTNLLERAKAYVQSQEGVAGIKRRYGQDKTFAVPILTNCALADILPWRQVPALPFELACLPQSWYRTLNLPVVSYAIPALVALGQARHHHAPSRNPLVRSIRQAARNRSLAILEAMQPESGGFLEATPLTAFVVMSLSSIGLAEHAVVRKGVEFLLASVRADGSWPIDTNLAVWNSAQAVTALHWDFTKEADVSTIAVLTDVPRPRSQPSTGEQAADLGQVHSNQGYSGKVAIPKTGASAEQFETLDWLLECQHRQRHPYTLASPGGWAWTDRSGGVPDADDTSAVLLALASWRHQFENLRQQEIESAAKAGIGWLLDLQNRDGGWPTFCRGWGKLPFDRSSTDITAHALRALHAWRNLWQLEQTDLQLHQQIAKATHTGLQFLENAQCKDGSWIPLWFGNQQHPEEWNCVYGTAKVLIMCHELGIHNSNMAGRGISWLTDTQLVCGGWGPAPFLPSAREGSGLPPAKAQPGVPTAKGQPGVKPSTVGLHSGGSTEAPYCSVEETALAVEALIALLDHRMGPEDRVKSAIEKGLSWLAEAILEGRHHDPSPIGFYFAKLWYHERLYPQIFTVQAISRATLHMDLMLDSQILKDRLLDGHRQVTTAK